MRKVDYFVLCETTTSDESSRVSLINVFDKITIANLPAKSNKFVLAFSIRAKAESIKQQFNLKIQFFDPKGEQILEASGEADRSSEDRPAGGVVKMSANLDLSNAIDFSTYGLYVYKLFLNDELMAENDFRIVNPKKKVGK